MLAQSPECELFRQRRSPQARPRPGPALDDQLRTIDLSGELRRIREAPRSRRPFSCALAAPLRAHAQQDHHDRGRERPAAPSHERTLLRMAPDFTLDGSAVLRFAAWDV